MTASEFETLLNQRLGLDAESIGPSAISRAVQERLSACNLADARAYWAHLTASEPELQQLIELVVVPETWFFRDAEAFAALSHFVLKEWLPAHPQGVLRLLSLPCSTGEEAYSIAMALLDAGVPAGRFEVDAVDVSARALERARQAIYGKNSFRARELGFRDRHFKAVAKGHQLNEAVCRQVRFQSGNLTDDSLLPGLEIYDVIFCRNLLIYFDQASQRRAVKVLLRLLKTEGLLFVGPSETALMTGHDFASLKIPLAFAFRKTGDVKHHPQAARARPRARAIPPTSHRAPDPEPAPPAPAPPAMVDIDEALRFADQGRLDEAAQRCEEFMRAHGPSAKAFYILGLIRDSAGETHQASLLYRKALYLDPHHHDALLQLALLLDKQGDKAGAKVLNERAARHKHKGQK